MTTSSPHPVLRQLETEIRRGIVGQEELIRGLLVALVAGGHVLIEGVPGLAKTRAVNLLARACHLQFRRVQFTPDLLPADIIGTRVYNQRSATFETIQGPVFTNVLLADEINRAPAKVQSALLETMQERQVTIGQTSYPVPPPFLVFATQNPIEQEGTYPLPEAQLDRFLLKLLVGYPAPESEPEIVRLVLNEQRLPEPRAQITHEQVLQLQAETREVFIEDRVIRYAADLVQATRTAQGSQSKGRSSHKALTLGRFVELGASPRASIALAQAARATALIEGRDATLPDDVKAVAHSVLRHRVLTTYYAEAEGVTSDQVIDEILSTVAVP